MENNKGKVINESLICTIFAVCLIYICPINRKAARAFGR